jgi:hypothetical protein
MPPAGGDRFIVTRSLGYTACASTPCTAPDGSIPKPTDRAEDTLTWKALTHKRWGDFLMINAAGNERNKGGTMIYPGLGEAAYDNHPAIAELTDPLFSFVTKSNLWDPLIPLDANGAAFDSLVADPATVAQLTNDVNNAGLAGPDSIPTNVLIVGSSTNELRSATQTSFVPPEQLTESLFSNSGSDLRAVGEGIFDPGLAPGSDPHAEGFNGTSYATPQVAALAAYLWLLSDDLRYVQPIEKTRQAILQNLRHNAIDAYAAVLSLDEAVPPTTQTAPVRLALLDVNGDGLFDEKDIDNILRFLYFVDGQGNITHQLPTNTQTDFSRYDLNGDGFTTASGDHRERFDLDRVGSTQYGTTVYSTVTQAIEGQPVGFNENELTDVEILCYYAYSPLYAGSFDVRKSLLDGRCSLSISPAKVTLNAGQSQTFTASSSATFTVSGGGTINPTTGKFTAGNTPGTYTVQATSTTDSSLVAKATVTVQPSACSVQQIQYLHYYLGNRGAQPNPIDSGYRTDVTQLSDSVTTAETSDSVSLSYGSIQVAASDSNSAAAYPGSPAVATTQLSDEIFISPVDPALQGKPINVTFSMQVTASSQVSSDRAIATWVLFSGYPFNFPAQPSGTRSTVPGQTSGDLSGGTYSVTAPLAFGPADIALGLSASIEYACAPNEGCPPPKKTGSGQVQASMHWGGMTVRDLAGNAIPFTVCSASGTNWAQAH